MSEQYRYLDAFIDEQRSNGKYTFTMDDLRQNFDISDDALKKSVQRLIKQKSITRIRQEFYVIVTPEYKVKGIIPTTFFVNDLMKFLNRDYYVGLLNAAALHGAAHQQPQNFSVIANGIPLRKIQNHNIDISFFTKKSWNKNDIQQRKVDTGFISISSPELTALDLVNYYDSVGGFNRIATVIEELKENMQADKLVETANNYDQIVVVQRLGFILEHILHEEILSNPLYEFLEKRDFYPTLLRPQKEKPESMLTGNRWKIAANIEVEADI